MKQHIKSIIKDYVEYINEEEWEPLFRQWYKDAGTKQDHIEDCFSEILTGDSTIKEFFDKLSEAEICDVEKKTINIRKNIIVEEIQKTVNKLLNPPYTKYNKLYFQAVKTHMNTFLGVKEDYVRRQFSKTCESLGLMPIKPNSKSCYIK